MKSAELREERKTEAELKLEHLAQQKLPTALRMMWQYIEEDPTHLQLFTKNAIKLISQKVKTASEEFSFLILKILRYELWKQKLETQPTIFQLVDPADFELRFLSYVIENRPIQTPS